MENITLSVESILCDTINSLGYTPTRSAGTKNNSTISQLPAAIIHPSQIVSAKGDERQRITLKCEVTAMKNCLSQSPTAISELYATIRHDFIPLSSLLKSDNRVVDVESFAITLCDNSERPHITVKASVKFNITVDFINTATIDQTL